ncbi:MAG: Anaerobic dehydrogenases, typically selenocysteine-containing [uncultured Thermomicrobiales bacterium]|uniref:Anaerobic dehydrogenases, typically selenocysteine-containing n=1 Tax=uncultured Thermomicrobiales bacterium TaxID=1645740 RepID=A0A6J4U606_9BACT|nr:MAG: Anaerobic dehydrogenases, typically selenocysteine-containing [uncultured Thermomicrobiales bacterium]
MTAPALPRPDGAATRLVRGTCPHDCPDTCGMVTEVRVADGRALRVTGDPDHPVTKGWICAKVRPYLDRVYHPDRLTHPLRRVGPKGGGRWERVSWDEAIAEIAERWRAIIAEHGAAAILPYSYSGTLGLLQLAVCNTRLWNRMGASGLERSICGAAAETAVAMTYGARWAPDPADLVHSRLILIWGHNPATTSPHAVPMLREAQRRGAEVVVIDPRRTLTARSADLHLRPRPSTDGALALGLMHVLFAEGLHDEPWLRAHTVGWEGLRDRVAAYTPARVAEITGIDAGQIVGLARRYGTTRPALLKFADGVQRHGNGGQTARALACLPAVVGQVGVRGGGLFYSTGGYVDWDAEAVGHAADPACPPTPRVVNMNRLGAALAGEVSDPPLKSLYVFNANPVAAAPNAGKIVEGLRRDDLFTVVHELFPTDTADYADLLLPATSQLEQVDLHKAYGHRQLSLNQPAIAPLGEAKSNWDTIRLLAAAMGYDEPWLRQDGEDVLAEVLAATKATTPSLRDVTLDRLRAEGTVPLAFPPGGDVPFADGVFPTPSGRLELRCDALAAHGLDPLPEWEQPAEFAASRQPSAVSPQEAGLVLISGASHHFVTTSMANLPGLERKEGTPFVELNPADAAARGIAHGDDVAVTSDRGNCTLRAVVTEDVPPGVAVAPKGRWAKRSPDGRNVNWTTSDALGDLAGQSTFHSNRVTVRPVTQTVALAAD